MVLSLLSLSLSLGVAPWVPSLLRLWYAADPVLVEASTGKRNMGTGRNKLVMYPSGLAHQLSRRIGPHQFLRTLTYCEILTHGPANCHDTFYR